MTHFTQQNRGNHAYYGYKWTFLPIVITETFLQNHYKTTQKTHFILYIIEWKALRNRNTKLTNLQANHKFYKGKKDYKCDVSTTLSYPHPLHVGEEWGMFFKPK